MWYIPIISLPGLSLLRSDLRGLCGVHRQSWNLGVNPGEVTGLPPEATTSTYCMGSSCPWVLHRVLAVKIKLDCASYVAWGVNTGQGAASKSRGAASKSAPRARAPARRTVCRHGRGIMAGPACTVPPTEPRFDARIPMVTMCVRKPTVGASRNGLSHWSAT